MCEAMWFASGMVAGAFIYFLLMILISATKNKNDFGW